MITKNSAKCNYCGTEIESTHRHDFVVHWCHVSPKAAVRWVGYELVEVFPKEITWNFAVDGGKDYIRRAGGGFTDTSEYSAND